MEKDNDFDVNLTKCRVTENSMLSFNEILKVCYCRFHTAIQKICLSDDVNYFLEEGNSSYKIYIFHLMFTKSSLCRLHTHPELK